jgi:hypothetical protein
VTQEDIEVGEQKSCGHCPVARAIRRDVPGAEAVYVTVSWINVYNEHQNCFLGQTTPRSAADFIRDYDAGRPVQPFSFEL